MINRRKFLTLAGTGAIALLGNGLIPTSFNSHALSGDNKNAADDLNLEIKIRSVPGKVSILSGPRTDVWRYTGEVLQGDPASLVNLHDESYLGPILRVKRGQKIRIIFQNALPASSIIHWHGLQVPAEMDGHPRFAVPPGGAYIYEFQVHDRAGTYWYHPHPHGRTGYQVYGGMAGLFLVSDNKEKDLNLPAGKYDLPLVIQDRTFDTDNQLLYLTGGMMNRMTGMMGEIILVNGRPDFKLDVSTRVYRLRLLNGSNARIYKLAWSDGTPLTILGTDGGFLSQPLRKSSVILGPGERLDVWADFSKYSVGSNLRLVSRSFDDGTSRMMGGNQGLSNGAPFNILQVHIVKKEAEARELPQRLTQEEPLSLEKALNRRAPRRFDLSMSHMRGLINGRSFKMTDVADDEMVEAGSSEIWDFGNAIHGMGMMGMQTPHPMHLHGAQFRVLKRSGNSLDGFVDEGWKDTVLLMPGEIVRLLVRFGDHKGLFLYHCHNLEHGDGGMMRNYLIGSRSSSDNEPATT